MHIFQTMHRSRFAVDNGCTIALLSVVIVAPCKYLYHETCKMFIIKFYIPLLRLKHFTHTDGTYLACVRDSKAVESTYCYMNNLLASQPFN
jgi:hypothetical protein